MQPDFQRGYVWDSQKASRLIESVLMEVPLPMIYISEDATGKEVVIDGQQRLTTFFCFIDGKFPDSSKFQLRGLKAFPELNGKLYSELSTEIQDKIRYYQIRVITILSDSDPDLKFEIFERLNTGSIPLNKMQLRNCVYRGKYMQLLRELAENEQFLKLIGMKSPDKKMKALELVLRFSAFYHVGYTKYRAPMPQFFNRDMERFRDITDKDAEELRKAFKNAVSIIYSMFGTDDFTFSRFIAGESSQKPQGNWDKPGRVNGALFDVLMGLFADKDKNMVMSKLDSLREGILDLMATNEEFNDSITLWTSQPKRVLFRFDIVRKRIDEILSDSIRQDRTFSRALKEKLFKTDNVCAICNNKIQTFDDAAVDHVEQYWLGGKTIPENARLTHRYCNMTRSRKELLLMQK